MNQSQRDDRQFRRGVVLGLTFAEILLLLIFLLMLILGARLIGLHRALDQERAHRAATEHQMTALQPLLAKLAAQQGAHFDITKEWVRLHDELAQAQASLADGRDLLSLMQQRRASEPGRTPQQIAREIANEASLGRRFANDAHSLSPQLLAPQAVSAYETDAAAGKLLFDKGGKSSAALAEAASCHTSLSTCKAQNANLTARLGGTLPPCWVDADGKTQYIFDAHLHEDGIWLVDNHVPGREADQAQLQISAFVFGAPMSVPTFVVAGQSLLDYSSHNDCRFYVRVFDETGAESKARYKELLQGVEGVFYKRLMQ
jgi:Tfp pilus assembly protein PilV